MPNTLSPARGKRRYAAQLGRPYSTRGIAFPGVVGEAADYMRPAIKLDCRTKKSQKQGEIRCIAHAKHVGRQVRPGGVESGLSIR